jgi:HSP20 family molecular chaperone IbpA
MNQNEINRSPQERAQVEIRTKGLSSDAQSMFASIERRAQELFEANGRIGGRDLENWVKAESELYPPAPFQVTESGDALKLEVDVSGFAPKELEVDLEPRRVIVIGKHHTHESRRTVGGRTTEEQYTHLLRCLGLPTSTDTSHATAYVNRGVLQVELKKTAAA